MVFRLMRDDWRAAVILWRRDSRTWEEMMKKTSVDCKVKATQRGLIAVFKEERTDRRGEW